MPAMHFADRPKTTYAGLCSIGLTSSVVFQKTETIEKVTCKSCIQKLMKYTGDTDLYKQAYTAPYIGL